MSDKVRKLESLESHEHSCVCLTETLSGLEEKNMIPTVEKNAEAFSQGMVNHLTRASETPP